MVAEGEEEVVVAAACQEVLTAALLMVAVVAVATLLWPTVCTIVRAASASRPHHSLSRSLGLFNIMHHRRGEPVPLPLCSLTGLHERHHHHDDSMSPTSYVPSFLLVPTRTTGWYVFGLDLDFVRLTVSNCSLDLS